MKPLFKKEISYYLNNPIGYIILILFAAFANFLFVKDIFIVGSASLRPFFGLIPWLLLIFIPALSMRILAEEKKSNTIEVLLTLPVSEAQIVLAKFFALVILIALACVLTLSLPISLTLLTRMYFPEIAAGYVGILFLSAAYISISMFFSSLTDNQVVAFLASAVALFFSLVLSTDFLANLIPKFALDVVQYFSPLYHLQNFVKGVIDMRSVVYFVSLSAVFLFLTVTNLKKRN